MKQRLHMKTKISSKILLSLGLAFVLATAITQVHGGSAASSAYPTSPEDAILPVVTISLAPGMSPEGKLVHSS